MTNLSLEDAILIKKLIWDGARSDEVRQMTEASLNEIARILLGDLFPEASWPDGRTGGIELAYIGGASKRRLIDLDDEGGPREVLLEGFNAREGETNVHEADGPIKADALSWDQAKARVGPNHKLIVLAEEENDEELKMAIRIVFKALPREALRAESTFDLVGEVYRTLRAGRRSQEGS